jgi:mRNA-degrading endonuclease toxin of MazEF toxin-antitoxin module
MVVPGTTVHKKRPGRITLPAGEGGVTEETYLLCDQLRTVDSVRMIRRCGAVDPRYVKQVLTLVHYFLTLEPE